MIVRAARKAAALVVAGALAAMLGCSLSSEDSSSDLAEPEVAGATTVAGTESIEDGPDASPTTAAEDPDDAAVEIAGTAWILTAVDLDGTPQDATRTAVPAVVNFGQDTIDAYDGINTISGAYELDGVDLSITVDEPSRIPYPGPRQPQYALFERLTSVRSVEREGDELRLVLPKDAALIFEPAAGGAPQN